MNDFGMTDFWKKSMEFQQNMLKPWLGAMQGAMPFAEGMTPGAMENPLSMVMKSYQDMYENWQQQFMNNPLMKSYPWSYNLFNTGNTPFDITNKMMNSGKTFSDLSSIWQKMVGKNPFESREEILKFLDENQIVFEKLAQDFMMPFLPETMRPMFTNSMALIKQYGDLGKDFVKPWLDGKLDPADWKKAMQGDGSAYIGLYKTMSKAYEDSFGRLFNAAGLGLTKEQNEEIMSQFDSYFKMMLALAELMTLVADVSKENMVSVIETYQGMLQNGAEPKSMKDFYELWVKISEEAFVKVFGTPQFSQIFGEFSKRACELKIHSDKVLEQLLSWAPFPKNSDMATLYKTVYDLRKSDYAKSEEVQTLKADMAALKEEVAALKEAINSLRKSK